MTKAKSLPNISPPQKDLVGRQCPAVFQSCRALHSDSVARAQCCRQFREGIAQPPLALMSSSLESLRGRNNYSSCLNSWQVTHIFIQRLQTFGFADASTRRCRSCPSKPYCLSPQKKKRMSTCTAQLTNPGR